MFWRNDSIVREENIFKVWVSLCILTDRYKTVVFAYRKDLIFYIFPIGSMIQGKVEHKACVPLIEQIGSGIGNVFIVVMFITVAIRLAKVHDGFFLKNEFKAQGCIVLFFAIPLVISNLIWTKQLKFLIAALSIWLMLFTSNILYNVAATDVSWNLQIQTQQHIIFFKRSLCLQFTSCSVDTVLFGLSQL
jgi:hypothetical protein